MRCYICDNELSENEINQGEDGKWEPCTTCLNIIMDTAYSNGFEPNDGNSHKGDALLEVEEEEING